MNGNGRKPSSKQPAHDECPWWHSGSKCVAMTLWIFTLAVAWQGAFDYNGWTLSSVVLLVLSFVLSVTMGCGALALGRQE